MVNEIHQLRLQLVDRIQQVKTRVQAILMIDAAVKNLMEENVQVQAIVNFMEKLNADIDELRDRAKDEMQIILHTASTRLRYLRERLFISATPVA